MPSPAPLRRGPRALACLLALVGLLVGIAGATTVAPAPAGATTVTTGGSILYVKDHNVWMIRPDGTGARQVTTNGTASSPYRSPSRSNDGSVIVAVRDVPEQPGGFDRSYIHVMGPTGAPLRPPFAPEQFDAELGGQCLPAVLVAPQGIDADVSPDGTRIVVLARASYYTFDCGGLDVATASILRIDGSVQVAEVRSAGSTQLSLRHPSWASNSRVLFHHSMDLTIHSYDVGAASTVEWASTTGQYEDLAYESPNLRAGRLATTGFNSSGVHTVRLWTATGPPTQPTPRCDILNPEEWPSVFDFEYTHARMAADGSAVVWQEIDHRGQTPQSDVYVSTVGDIGSGCSSLGRQLLVDGGSDPAWSPAPVSTSTATVPGAPTGVAATAGNGQATVSWTAPASTGGSPITGYTVTPYIGTTAQPARTTGTATSLVVTGLTNGTAYTFRVAARNAVGTGPQSSASRAVTPTGSTAAVPGAPTGVAASAGNAEATVSWTAPASTGGSPITGYTVTPYIGTTAQPARTTGTATSLVVTGLTNGTAYTFRVAARNAVGTGPESSPSPAVTPTGVTDPNLPGPPTITAVEAGDARVTLTWTAPTHVGASPVNGYLVTPYLDGQPDRTRIVTGPVLTTTVTGLLNARAYTFRVAARNSHGGGALSAPTEEVTPYSAHHRFVLAAYHDFLDRPPTASELDQTARALAASATSRGAVVRELARSPEWVSAVVDAMYVDTLGRPGEPSGVAFWVGQIRSGRRTVAQVAASFYASPEYFEGIGSGTLGSWVADLYAKLLQRTPEAGGVEYWAGEAERRGRVDVAHRFFQSPESARTRVAGLYDALLGRAPEPGGATYWAGRVVREGDIALATNLAASQEYLDRAQTRF